MKYIPIAILSIICVACAPKSTNENQAGNQGVLTDAQKHALAGAKKTEAVIQAADEQRRKELDDAEK